MEAGWTRVPRQVSLIVYSARDLLGHKKGDVCHTSVVFGHGKDFYTTEVVEGSAPEWNQEASIAILNHFQEPIRFKVKDKEHTLGIVTVTLFGLPSSPNKQWLPLQPHKKASKAHGSLHIGCWVTEYWEKGSVQEAHLQHSRGGFLLQRHPPTTNRHFMSERTLRGGHGESDFGLHTFQSDSNLQKAKTEEEDELTNKMDDSAVPEVTGVSPNEGPVGGGQRVILRGSCLGQSSADVVQVLVAGVDCSGSLEYFSPSKLAVVTEPREAPGSGPVVVHTQSGGVGVSWINFSFIEDSNHGRRTTSGAVEPAESALLAELKMYKQQVKELKDSNKSLLEENEQLHSYIDRLLLGVLTHSPGMLEVQSSTTASLTQ